MVGDSSVGTGGSGLEHAIELRTDEILMGAMFARPHRSTD